MRKNIKKRAQIYHIIVAQYMAVEELVESPGNVEVSLVLLRVLLKVKAHAALGNRGHCFYLRVVVIHTIPIRLYQEKQQTE